MLVKLVTHFLSNCVCSRRRNSKLVSNSVWKINKNMNIYKIYMINIYYVILKTYKNRKLLIHVKDPYISNTFHDLLSVNVSKPTSNITGILSFLPIDSHSRWFNKRYSIIFQKSTNVSYRWLWILMRENRVMLPSLSYRYLFRACYVSWIRNLYLCSMVLQYYILLW